MNTELIAQLDAEIKAKQELREIALAVEAGAEWEVNWPGLSKWLQRDGSICGETKEEAK